MFEEERVLSEVVVITVFVADIAHYSIDHLVTGRTPETTADRNVT